MKAPASSTLAVSSDVCGIEQSMFKEGDRVIIKAAVDDPPGTVVSYGVRTYIKQGYIAVKRDDGKEGGSVTGVWLCLPDQLELIEPPTPPVPLTPLVPTKSRFELIYEELED